VFLHAINIMLSIPELAQERLAVLGNIISNDPLLIKLSSKGRLGLGQHVGSSLKLLQLAEKVTILSGHLPLGSLKVSQGKVTLLNLLAQVIQGSQKVPVRLLSRGSRSVDFISSSTDISNLMHDLLLVLFNLGLHLGELINLLSHLSNGILVLLLQSNQGRFLLNVSFLKILPELGNLGLSLLVELNLGSCSTTGLSQSLSKVLQFPSQVRSLPFSLGSGLSLSLQLLFHLFNTGLLLLDGLLDLGNKRLLIFKLAEKSRGILLLPGNSILNLLPGPLKLSNSFLGDLELTFNLPALLLNIGSASLFLVKRALKLIKSLLKLVLDLVQMVDLVLSNLEVFTCLGSIFIQVLLLLVQLVDDFILVGNFIIQASDGVVTVGLLLLQFLDSNFNVLNVLLDNSHLLLKNFLVSSSSLSLLLLLGQKFLGSSQLSLQVSLLGRDLGLLLMIFRNITLLSFKLFHHCLEFFLDRNIFLQESSLGLHLFIIGTILFIGKSLKLAQLLFRVGHTNKRPGLLDDDKPSPFSHGDILSELPLADNNELSLSTLLLIDNISHSLEDLTLHVTNKLQDNVISGLLKHSKSTSTEEDKSVTKTISFPGEVDLVHQSVGSSLVVTRASNFSSSKDSISQLVVRVEHSVGESSHTDSDTLKHTITSELVHDKRRLNLSRLLVSVGHKATHKVRLTAVQSGHELTKRDQVDGGDSLTAATLLLLLTLFLGGSSRLSRMISPQMNQELAFRSGLEDLNNAVIDRVLVLLKPVGDIVGHNTSIVRQSKVGVLVSLGLGLQEDRQLAQGSLQLLLKGLVSSLREKRLLLKNCPDTHGLFKHDDASSQVHTKVNHLPVNTFLDIFLLFHNKHVVIEELLELLIDKVDGDLFKAIVLKNLKASNVKHSTEVGLLQGSINKSVITLLNQPLEETVKNGSGNTTNSIGCLLASLTLGHPLSTDLDPGFAERLDERGSINTAEGSSLARVGVRANLLTFSLVISTLGLELNTTIGHDTSCEQVAVKLFPFSKAKNIESILSVLKLLIVINGGNSGLTHGHIDIVINVRAETALLPQASFTDAITIGLDELVEDMVGSLNLLLLSDTGLLKEVGHNVTTSQLARSSKVNTDELTKTGGVVIPRGLGITIRLQNGVSGNNLVLKGNLLSISSLLAAGGHHGQVGDDLLGVFSLSGSRLTSDQHSLILGVVQHASVGSLSNSPQVRGALITPLAQVDLGHPGSVDGVTLVGVDNHHKQTRVGVDHLGLVTGLQVPEDRSVIKEGQVDHVLALLKLGRVDLANINSLVGELLVSNTNNTLAGRILKITRLKETLTVTSSLGVRDPDRLLGIIRLLLVSPLHVHGGEEVLCGVGVHSTLR